MTVFDTHAKIVDDYASYIRSFMNIGDPESRQTVDEALGEGKLWPEPLLQFNPAYELAGSILANKVAKVSKKPAAVAESGFDGLLKLRQLHRELDLAVRDAYGWHDLDLGHDFHEVETLPENDRVRYTISPAARKE